MKNSLLPTANAEYVDVTHRQRAKADEAKISTMVDFISIIGNDDIDTLFISVFTAAIERGYRFINDDPEHLLHTIERVHG